MRSFPKRTKVFLRLDGLLRGRSLELPSECSRHSPAA
jgi:hypothetical protein